MSKKSSQRRRQTEGKEGIQLGFAGRVMVGQDRQLARDEIRANFINEPGSLEIMRELFRNHPARLEENRREWESQGVRPPWEGLLGEDIEGPQADRDRQPE